MARQKRIYRPYACHHVILRGVDGKNLFEDDRDRVRFCLLLQEASERHRFRVHAFCLMTNHVHLVLEPTTVSLSKCEHAFASRYAQYYNRRYDRRGYLYQTRFLSILVETGVYLRRLTRYLHLNPVSAGMVEEPEQYLWSSYRAYLGNAQYTWLYVNHVLDCFGLTRDEAVAQMVNFTEKGTEAQEDFEQIRQAFGVGAYGSPEFVDKSATGDGLRERVLPLQPRLSLEEAIARVCLVFDISPEDLKNSKKTHLFVDARSVLAVLPRLDDSGHLTPKRVATALEKTEGTISRLAARAGNRPDLLDKAHRILLPS